MALNPFGTGRADPVDYGDILFSGGGAGWTISFRPNTQGITLASADDPEFVAPAGPVVLAEADVAAGTLDTFPLNTTSISRGLFQAKYRRVKVIRFEGQMLSEIEALDDALTLLGSLPSGFVRSPKSGLGVDYELRAITDALDELDIDGLVIRSGRRHGLPKIEGRRYVMAKVQFDALRRAVRRVHVKALGDAAEEKARVAHNELLTAVDPIGHRARPPIYRPGGVTAIIAQRSGADLSTADQKAVISAACSAAKSTAEREPEALLQLSREIELVTLDQLVARFRKLLEDGSQEGGWQKFFLGNPFILRLAFGYPVIQFQDQISVGGGKFNGTGGKISDFALKAAATGNLALVEIKTPGTPLLDKAPYRGGVYGPSRELAGAVNQVLDQVYQLQYHLPNLKETSGIHDVHAFAMQGLVVAGRTSENQNPNQSKSLELFRHSLKSVMVITFDEMLIKLENLAAFLRSSD